jgi:hypothetical protein
MKGVAEEREESELTPGGRKEVVRRKETVAEKKDCHEKKVVTRRKVVMRRRLSGKRLPWMGILIWATRQEN